MRRRLHCRTAEACECSVITVNCTDCLGVLDSGLHHACPASSPYFAALRLVVEERNRQEKLWPGTSCANETLPWGEKLAIFVEEAGEVAKEFNEARERGGKVDETKLRMELVQVAAVCAAWVESLL